MVLIYLHLTYFIFTINILKDMLIYTYIEVYFNLKIEKNKNNILNV